MSTEMGASPDLSKWRLEEVEYWREADDDGDAFTGNSGQGKQLGINRINRDI